MFEKVSPRAGGESLNGDYDCHDVPILKIEREADVEFDYESVRSSKF